jgi:hypothetical protein
MVSKLRVHEVEVYSQPVSHLRVLDVQVTPAAANSHLRVFEVELIGGAPAVPVANQTVESLSTVTIPTPTSQTGGPTVTLSGSGSTRTFTAPATVDGATITFDVSGSNLVVAVKAHQWWVNRGGTWKPFTLNIIP